MYGIDFIISFYLIWGIKKGYKRGLCTELSAAIGWGLILFTGSGLFHWVSHLLSTLIGLAPHISNFIGFIFVVVGTIIVLFPLRNLFKHYIQSKIKKQSRQSLGAVAGLLRTSFIAVLIISLLSLIPIQALQQYLIHQSLIGQLIHLILLTK